MFNAMRAFHHRDPGVVGLLGHVPSEVRMFQLYHPKNHASNEKERPCYGLITDGVHTHRSSVAIAFSAHPTGASEIYRRKLSPSSYPAQALCW